MAELPSEEDFNRDWVTPRRALELLGGLYDDLDTRKRWIMERLKSGFLLAVARHAEMGGKQFGLISIPHNMWDQCDGYGEYHFWITGDEVLFVKDHRFRFFDIRVQPENLFGDLPETLDQQPLLMTETLPDDRSPLSKADAQRFCRAILEGWPGEVTQDWAYEKALLFFPDKRIARDSFRSILRSIRGSVKPGKRPKTME